MVVWTSSICVLAVKQFFLKNVILEAQYVKQTNAGMLWLKDRVQRPDSFSWGALHMLFLLIGWNTIPFSPVPITSLNITFPLGPR